MFEINIIHWNCFKLTSSRLFELEVFINRFKPDIMSLQEIKLSSEDANYKLRFDGYSTYHRSRSKNSDKGGGVAVLVNDRINHSIYPDLDYVDRDLEIIGIKIEIGTFNCNIFSYYNPPDITLDLDFFLNLYKSNDNFLVVGDLNSKTPVVGCRSLNSSGRLLEKILTETDLVVFNNNSNTYFQFQSNYEELLDLIIGSGSLVGSTFDYEVLDNLSLLSSDHCPIKIKINEEGEFKSNSNSMVSRFNFSKADWYSFSSLLLERVNVYNNSYLDSLDVNELNSLVSNDILYSANITIPRFKKGRLKTFPEPILKLIRKRRELRKDFKTCI